MRATSLFLMIPAYTCIIYMGGICTCTRPWAVSSSTHSPQSHTVYLALNTEDAESVFLWLRLHTQETRLTWEISSGPGIWWCTYTLCNHLIIRNWSVIRFIPYHQPYFRTSTETFWMLYKESAWRCDARGIQRFVCLVGAFWIDGAVSG